MLGLAQAVERLEAAAAELAALDPHGQPAREQTAAMEALERVEAQIAAARARLVTQVEADGTWTSDGSRSLQAWVRRRTGRFQSEAAATVSLARALRDHLPNVAASLSAGEISVDHARVLARYATSSPACREMLGHPELGERFLLEQAQQHDATVFTRVVKHWALRADPEAGDRRWREDTGREQFSFAQTMDGWAGQIWLNEANGALVHRALEAWGGVAGTGDLRSAGERRAAALVEMAGAALDSGSLQPGARIRPHLGITADLATLQALIKAQEPATADTDPAAAGDVDDEVLDRISAALDHSALVGVAPAELEDGTPIPFSIFALLACESHLHRVIFGARGEILDVGRESRLFTTGQTRGILARDRSCRFPGCTAPAGVGEIHHSLWYYAHHGPTATRNGVLLCRYHHSLVHRLGLSIERRTTHWRFVRPGGTVYGTSPTAPPVGAPRAGPATASARSGASSSPPRSGPSAGAVAPRRAPDAVSRPPLDTG